jgi:hypothetical protein
MIEAWRAVWHVRTDSITDPAFPFGFVQVERTFFLSPLSQLFHR